jgi:hypothetical protein
MQTWEYTFYQVSPDRPNLKDGLNDLGMQGWELVTIYERQRSMICVFKREKPNS